MKRASATERKTKGPCDNCHRLAPLVYGLCPVCYNTVDRRFDIAGAFHAPKLKDEV